MFSTKSHPPPTPPTLFLSLYLFSTFPTFPLPSSTISPFCYFRRRLLPSLNHSYVISFHSLSHFCRIPFTIALLIHHSVCTYEEIRKSFNGSSQNVILFSCTEVLQAAPVCFKPNRTNNNEGHSHLKTYKRFGASP